MAIIPLTRGGPENGGNFEYPWSGDYLQAHFLSDIGRKRKQNEDSCILCAPEDKKLEQERGLLFAVADGMGGVTGGEFASRLALQSIVEYYYGGPPGNIPERLRQAVIEANRRIFEEAENHPEYHGMGTTVSLVLVNGDSAYLAQVGDSRVYLWRAGRNPLSQLTEDHSIVAEQVRNGYLSEEEAQNHSLKNLITRAVGTREAIKVDLFSLKLQVGDSLLICSDGLSNMVRDDEIAAALKNKNLQAAARVLVGRALEAGGTDNITVALVRVTKQPPKMKLDEGATPVPVSNRSFLARLKRLFG